MKNPFWRKLILILLVAGGAEVILRLIGFGNIPVYYSSDLYEYALEPKQEMKRFGNSIYINAEGMRSDELEPGDKPILKFGDSVLHGGVATDQSDLASEILESRFESELPKVRILNIAAGSWGPDNAFAWMMEHSDFDAQAIVLVFSSHDWQDQMTFRKVVGEVSFYPESRPFLALTDAAEWFYSRWFSEVDWDDLEENEEVTYKGGKFNRGWQQFIDYCAKRGIPLVVYHHADLEEVTNKKWNKKGAKLEAFLADKNIARLSGLESGMEKADFRDEIHLTPSGQRKLANALEPTLTDILLYSDAE
ncbi:MAG: hypothetical protein ABR574_05565 [Cryomorphaceae bacterium]|nr:hypothetical protein [Flavobacteriales bacterium]